jgi:four helix bundle protein
MMNEMNYASTPSFRQWQAEVAREQPGLIGPLWKMTVYRLALYAIDLGWLDVTRLEQRKLVRPVASQLYRALGSIAANIAEGYSRSSGADRVRLFEYALGSARESLVWYRAARSALPADIVGQRVDNLVQVSKLLCTIIPAERSRLIRKGIRTADDGLRTRRD